MALTSFFQALFRHRVRGAHQRRTLVVFSTSALLLLVLRLSIGCINPVYLTHAIVIFFDHLLAVLFSESIKFNICLHIISVGCIIGYLFRKTVFFELLETTLMAFIATVFDTTVHYEIFKLNLELEKIREKKEEAMEHDTSIHTLRESHVMEDLDLENKKIRRRLEHKIHMEGWEEVYDHIGKGKFFLKELLDGSSGIMYTSLAGLVFVELVGVFFNIDDSIYCTIDI